jgi:hypothetical protein
MDNKMFDANLRAVKILQSCFDKVDKEWKWYKFFRWNRIINAEERLIRASSHLLYSLEVILSVEDN